MPTRRQFLKGASAAGALLYFNVLGGWGRAFAAPAAAGLSDPVVQPKFVEFAPNALDPGFIFEPLASGPRAGQFNVYVRQSVQQTGLRRNGTGKLLNTTVWGYGYDDRRGVTWPGRTFQVESGHPTTVRWNNDLVRGNRPLEHLLSVDTSLHWAYSLPGYEQYTIKKDGVPIVTHLHGGHSAFQFDGNPEFFWSPDYEIVGPSWFRDGLDGIIKDFLYLNDQPAGNLWYHDHALGITRLNVYAGLAGFYFIRDEVDTGQPDNPAGLPAWPYELAYAIQDRMFTDKGDLFYPAFPGDPFYDDFITGEGASLPPDIFRGGGPTALAEFFGDHMVVNGKIWPKTDVEPRSYRMHLLNGTDSRFLVVRFRVAATPTSTDLLGAGSPMPFNVVGSDQGLASSPTMTDTLVIEPGGRYDLVFDFAALGGSRVIMENIGGDAPFGGDFGGALPPDAFFPNRQTDRIMAFDVATGASSNGALNLGAFGAGAAVNGHGRLRKVALFEGMDEFGRLQPLLGTAEPATDYAGNPINWPSTPAYENAGLVGQIEGTVAWHSPTTENPALGSTEEWEIWNVTGDAHPVHLHLVHFEIMGRQKILWDSATNEEDRVLDPDGITAPAPNGDGTYLVTQPVVQHHGLLGNGFRIVNLTSGAVVDPNDDVDGPEYVENAPKDMVTALPDQITRIKATFDKPGRYVWHCHILSHEDHEMMRVLHVGPGA